MIKLLKNHFVLEDGAVFRYLRVLPESVVRTSSGPIKLHNWKGLIMLLLRRKKVQLSQSTTYVIVNNSYRGYYHWVLESLPRLLEAKQHISDFTLLLPATYTEEFYADTLKLIGVRDVLRLNSDSVACVPKLALPFLAEPMGHYSYTTLRLLKATFFKALNLQYKQEARPSRLYISRRKANRRKVVNEDQVEGLLAEFGFSSVCFEDYALHEQIQLCANAQALIGIHGAGLSNMVFMPEQAIVVELRKFDNGENYFFTELAHTLKHNYELLYCSSANEQQSVQDADLLVSIDSLREIVSQKIASVGYELS